MESLLGLFTVNSVSFNHGKALLEKSYGIYNLTLNFLDFLAMHSSDHFVYKIISNTYTYIV